MFRIISGIVLAVTLWAARSYAEDAGTGSTRASDPKAPTQLPPLGRSSSEELAIVPHGLGDKPDDYTYRLGETLVLRAKGATAALLRAEFAKPVATRVVTLGLNGTIMAAVKPTPLDLGADGIELSFPLIRDANDGDSRQEWNDLLKKSEHYRMWLPVSLAVGTGLPIGTAAPGKISFEVASPLLVGLVSAGGLLAFIGIFAFLIKARSYRSILLDGKSRLYSLGKAQMVFWGLLVFLAVIAVLIITGNLERIPPQTLTLLGISAGTGLGAALITKTKQGEVQEKAKALVSEEEQLTRDQAAALNTFPQSGKDRLQSVRSELKGMQANPVSGGFFSDIISDGNGPTFHRVQIVIWTFLLGAFFVYSVVEVISMPEFPESLLLLMGISNGTYLGLKIPE